jgi:hypothetical protein
VPDLNTKLTPPVRSTGGVSRLTQTKTAEAFT